MPQYPSQLLEKAVDAFAQLPGIGRKSALKMALFMLKSKIEVSDSFIESIHTMCHNIKHCEVCHNISDTEICDICNDKKRQHDTICVVETIKEVLLIENTAQYRGVYHVLGGTISPMNGISPADIEIQSLIDRIEAGGISEVILALNPNMDGDTTSFYIYRKLAHCNVNITTIARGISIGDDLEYADEITLGNSITNRIKYQTT